MSSWTAPPKIISCEVLRDEIERVNPGYEIDFVEGALHDYPDKLRARLQERIDATPGDCPILLSCARCSNGTVGLRGGSHRLVVPAADDCISILLGSRRRYLAEHGRHPGTYYYTRGWIDYIEDPYQEYLKMIPKYGEEKAAQLERMILANYTRVAVIDTGDLRPGEAPGLPRDRGRVLRPADRVPAGLAALPREARRRRRTTTSSSSSRPATSSRRAASGPSPRPERPATPRPAARAAPAPRGSAAGRLGSPGSPRRAGRSSDGAGVVELHRRERGAQVAEPGRAALALEHLEAGAQQLDRQARAVEVAQLPRLFGEAQLLVADGHEADRHVEGEVLDAQTAQFVDHLTHAFVVRVLPG